MDGATSQFKMKAIDQISYAVKDIDKIVRRVGSLSMNLFFLEDLRRAIGLS